MPIASCSWQCEQRDAEQGALAAMHLDQAAALAWRGSCEDALRSAEAAQTPTAASPHAAQVQPCTSRASLLGVPTECLLMGIACSCQPGMHATLLYVFTSRYAARG